MKFERYPGSASLPENATKLKPIERWILDTIELIKATVRQGREQVNECLKLLSGQLGIKPGLEIKKTP